MQIPTSTTCASLCLFHFQVIQRSALHLMLYPPSVSLVFGTLVATTYTRVVIKNVVDGPLSNDTGSIESMQLAKRWLHECKAHHKHCNSKNTGFLPKRLLDVGLRGLDMIRLCVCEQDSVTGPYITLSHCWGEAIFLKLIKTTFPMLRQGIPFEDLPATFRDAVNVCRELGVQYIWIDSLCIFHDSRSDWRTKSSHGACLSWGPM